MADQRDGGIAWTPMFVVDGDRVRRRAASSAHPDKGGSNELMARVNAAWARFARERGL